VLIPAEHCREQAGLEVVELGAGIPQSGDLHNSLLAESQPSAGGQAEQVDAARSDILAEVAWYHRVAGRSKLLVQLGVNEVHLTKVRLGGIARHARAVLHGDTLMRIAIDAEAGEQADRRL